jgi:ABC-2 type transport system ATP-binding protein
MLLVEGMTVERVGDLAFAHQTPVHELSPIRRSLEEAYLRITADAVEFATGGH